MLNKKKVTIVLLLLWLPFSWSVHAQDQNRILIVTTGTAGSSKVMLATLQKTPGLLERIDLQVVTLESFTKKTFSTYKNTRLVISVGSRSAHKLMAVGPTMAVIHTLIPRSTFEQLQKIYPSHKKQSVIFINQPIGRRFDLLKVALPGRKKVAVILGPRSKIHASRLAAAANSRALSLSTITISQVKALVPSLSRILVDSEVLFVLPDAKVVNAYTSKNLLLTTYRKGVPVLGYSKAYVKAGALLAVYSSPSDIGRQLGELLLQFPTTQWHLPPPSYPKYYSVAANYHVARILRVHLKTEDVLTKALRELEKKEGSAAIR